MEEKKGVALKEDAAATKRRQDNEGASSDVTFSRVGKNAKNLQREGQKRSSFIDFFSGRKNRSGAEGWNERAKSCKRSVLQKSK